VPCGALDGLPWAALAAVTGHVPTVAPSARAWLAAQRAGRPDPARGGRLVLVAGPDLPGGTREVAALAADAAAAFGTTAEVTGTGAGRVEVLTGAAASTPAVFAAMEGAETVHVAAHGRFRADNPLFSSLRLADGAACAYEFERVRRPPQTLVLSSCEAALTSTTGGDAVLGLATALLRRGVRHLVAPVVEIPDTATAELMRALHQRLRAGDDPTTALTAAVVGFADETPEQAAVAGAFVAMGA
jgi:CHAT domain-containing protein